MMNQHFLIISCPSQGHINPSLQLAKRLIRDGGARVTFVTSARGLDTMRSPLALDGLSYAAFSDRFEDGDRPAGVRSDDPMLEMKLAGSRSLEDLITRLSSENPITCLIYTILLPWAAEVACRFHVPSAFLSIQSATTFAIYRHFFNSQNGLYSSGVQTEPMESIMLHDDLPPFESHDLPSFLLPNSPHYTVTPTFHEHIRILEDDPSARVLLNTFHALEEGFVGAVGDMKLIPIGPLIPLAYIEGIESSSDREYGCDLFDCSRNYLQWLDTKQKSSVVYASFGSMVVLKEDEVEEIFEGLVETDRPFLLVIRPASEGNSEGITGSIVNKMMTYLDGKEQGFIVPWCSQVEVLSHPSVGCFVTHGGWNSTLESLAMGVPMVACPHFSDQLTNAKMVDQVWKNGIRVRAGGSGVVEREEIRRCVEVVMGDGDRGEEIRRNASKWKGMAMEALAEGGSSHNNLRNFMDSCK